MGISTSRLCDRRAYRGRIDGEYRMRAPSVASRSRTRDWRTATGPMPRRISVRESVKAPGWASLMTLLSDTAYHSFNGEVEAFNTTTIRRLTRSRRHQLLAIAHCRSADDTARKGPTFRAIRALAERPASVKRASGEARP